MLNLRIMPTTWEIIDERYVSPASDFENEEDLLKQIY